MRIFKVREAYELEFTVTMFDTVYEYAKDRKIEYGETETQEELWDRIRTNDLDGHGSAFADEEVAGTFIVNRLDYYLTDPQLPKVVYNSIVSQDIGYLIDDILPDNVSDTIEGIVVDYLQSL